MKKREHTKNNDSIIHNNASSNGSVLLISRCIYNHTAKVFWSDIQAPSTVALIFDIFANNLRPFCW